MDLKQTIGTAETHGYNPGIMAILKMLGEIAQNGEPVALVPLTKLELHCISVPSDSTHQEASLSAVRKVREAGEQLAQMRAKVGRDDEPEEQSQQALAATAFLERPPAVLPRQTDDRAHRPE